MTIGWQFIWRTVGVLLVCLTAVSEASGFEKKLLEKLFSGYKKDMRPALKDVDTVTVKIGLSLHQIMDVDEKNQIITTSVWARQKWYNPYLKWNKSDYGNVSTINVISKNIWVPDIVLYNNADESIDFRGYLDKLQTRVQIHHDGLNVWLSPVMLRSKCKINVQYFPFDSQTCKLKFGSWTYDGYRVDVQNESDSVDQLMYVESAEWRLDSAPVKRNVLHYFCCPEPYPDITFHLNIQRRSLFYLTNLILPLIVISILIVFVFTLPPESGERISLSITILLAMTVFMLLVTETIPPTSEVIPLVAKFYMAAMCEIAVALIVTCYILRCYHSAASEVPRWMRRYIVGKLANFFGINKSKVLLKEEKEEESMRKLKSKARFLEKMMDKMEELEDEGRKMLKGNGTMNDASKLPAKLINGYDGKIDIPRHENGVGFASGKGYELQHPNNLDSGVLSAKTEGCDLTKRHNTKDHVGHMMLKKLEIISSNVQAKERVELVKEQWHIVAVVIDRVAMWTFATASILTIFTIFYQSPGYVA